MLEGENMSADSKLNIDTDVIGEAPKKLLARQQLEQILMGYSDKDVDLEGLDNLLKETDYKNIYDILGVIRRDPEFKKLTEQLSSISNLGDMATFIANKNNKRADDLGNAVINNHFPDAEDYVDREKMHYTVASMRARALLGIKEAEKIQKGEINADESNKIMREKNVKGVSEITRLLRSDEVRYGGDNKYIAENIVIQHRLAQILKNPPAVKK
jgi:hypothetical protein